MQSWALRQTETWDTQNTIVLSGWTAEIVSLAAHKACMILINWVWVRDYDTYWSGDLMSFDSPREDIARGIEK